MRWWVALTATAAAILPTGPHAADEAPPALALPIDCKPGTTCFVQQLFDHDPTPASRDFRCGTRTYDGHDGTDIRLPNLVAMRRGVAVLAAAEGVVLAQRDGVPDHLAATDADRAAIKGHECGNGVLIGHGGGWQTQYCHMARGSIAVKDGQQVRPGERLGLVGLSGDTQFPHLHLSVRQFKRKVDPYAPDLAEGQCSLTGGAPNGGGLNGGRALWSPAAAAALAWKPSEVINTGFATAPVTMADIEEGQIAAPTPDAPALIFWIRAIGLKAGDRVTLRLTGPTGTTIAESTTEIPRTLAQWMGLAGHRTPPGGWAHGRYTGFVTISRNGLISETRTLMSF